MVDVGAGSGARREPAHCATFPRGAYSGWQGGGGRARPGTPLDGAAGAGFPDKLVTPGCAPRRLGWSHNTNGNDTDKPMKRSAAEIVREYGPFPNVTDVAGV